MVKWEWKPKRSEVKHWADRDSHKPSAGDTFDTTDEGINVCLSPRRPADQQGRGGLRSQFAPGHIRPQECSRHSMLARGSCPHSTGETEELTLLFTSGNSQPTLGVGGRGENCICLPSITNANTHMTHTQKKK